MTMSNATNVKTACYAFRIKYAKRVEAFLQNPSQDWMRAMGYDKDHMAFTIACEAWKQMVQRNCESCIFK